MVAQHRSRQQQGDNHWITWQYTLREEKWSGITTVGAGWRPHGWVVQVKAELRSGSILSENRQTSCAPLAFASGFDGTELERKER